MIAGVLLAAATYANPIDIDYRYNFEQLNEGISYRTGADPAIVRHKGAFYLFATLADGYWRSTDLVRWTFVKPSRWPFQGVVAPAVWSDGERLYIMPSSTEPQAILVSDDPASGRLDFLTRRTPPLQGAVRPGFEDRIRPGELPPGPWDPALFRDDDARWYLYWGSSNVFPLYGARVEMGERFRYLDPISPLIALRPDLHGWERFGRDHSGTEDGRPMMPFVEGAWMTKVAGRYYLQYAAPGAEHNVYANGTYVGTSPLGPFAYAPYNPVAYKPGGFVEGAGHGSTFEDGHGNWWNAGTAWIGYNWRFERRVTLFAAHFYPDGQMAVSTRFGDFPHYVPNHRVTDPDALFTGWMLLSYRKSAVASSTLAGFGPGRATDENPRTFWVSATSAAGETLTVDLGRVDTVRAVQVNFADYRAGRFADAPDIYADFRIETSVDGKLWQRVADTGDTRRDRPNAYLALPDAVPARHIRYVHGHVGARHLAIADFRVFGNAGSGAPARPRPPIVRRGPDPRSATIGWHPVPGAVGYNVRWGIRPDRLTLTYQVFADDAAMSRGHAGLTLHALNGGVPYWFAVEAFDERGVSPVSAAVRTR